MKTLIALAMTLAFSLAAYAGDCCGKSCCEGGSSCCKKAK